MISKVSIRNYKSLREVDIDLERFTVFVGPNASGKSSILQVIDLLCRGFRPHDGYVEQCLSEGRSRGGKGIVEVVATSFDKFYRYRTRIDALPLRPAQPNPDIGASISFISSQGPWEPFDPPAQRDPGISKSVFLRLEISKLVLASIPNGPADSLNVMLPDGTGVHAALSVMALNDPDSWQRLQDDLRQIIPTISRVRHDNKHLNNGNYPLLFDTISGEGLFASQVSEGTLLVIGILAALYSPGRPNLILLDDLDRGLHPKAQTDLINLLRKQLEIHPELQILATTHSPYLLDCIEPREVRMTYLRDDGTTSCAMLEKHPNMINGRRDGGGRDVELVRRTLAD